MIDPSQLIELFRKAGLRWTSQRDAVVDVLWGSTSHPTAEEVYQEVKSKHARMSRATVYNTMDALVAMGQIETIHANSGTRRFDPNPIPHHHLVCRGCSRIYDLPLNGALDPPKIPPAVTDGFQVEGYRIEFQGLCSPCARSGPAEPAARRRQMLAQAGGWSRQGTIEEGLK